MEKQLQKMGITVLMLLMAIVAKAADVEAVWDFQNMLPEGISSTAIQGTTGTVASTVEGIELYVDATNGKLQARSSDAQFNSGTIIRVPVLSAGDVVTVVSYPGYHNYTVGGVAADDNTVEHSALASEASQGYVEIVATGSSYLYLISVLQKSPLQEKPLYSTNFSDWTYLKAKTEATIIEQQTKYSHETLNFTIYNTEINPAGTNSKFNNGDPLGWLMASKSDDPYVMTSTLASVTKVRFVHAATGSNRGWKLWAKGDGDDDWVIISQSVAEPAGWCEVNATVNRNNVQLKWTNLNASQNAYMFELDIFGKVDMSGTPTLGSFKVNGTSYEAGDIFTEQSDGTMTATIEISKNDTMISESNPLTDIVAENGEVTSVTYENDGDNNIATILVEANGETTTYMATFVFKPDFTLTYYNVDGSTIGTQMVEKDAVIGTFSYGESDVTVTEGSKFRGWAVKADGGRKYTIDDVVTSDIPLYALVTEIETASTTARYNYLLTDPYFYPEDHEAFDYSGNTQFHDAQHGWDFNPGAEIKLTVGGHAYITLGLCRYSKTGSFTLTDANGEVVGTISLPADTDGENQSIEYTGAAGILTLTTDCVSYIHQITINNIEDAGIAKNGAGYYVVRAGDADHLLTTLAVANAESNADERTYVFLPDGLYDLGKTVLTPIYGKNISIIGQSMENTIVKNAPDKENEGIGVTATFLVTGENTYFQDLTIQNALDYYAAGAAGRAVCIQDRGNRTICKNVKMLSYQDTYYSNAVSQFYWETSEIHGAVDFICGGGDVYFKECTLVGESRANDKKSGEATLTAPYPTGSEQWGYVFESCTIENKAATFSLGRSWGGESKLAYLNTTINQPGEIVATRFNPNGMNTLAYRFKEYKSTDPEGNVVSPESNIVTFKLNKDERTLETIMTDDEAAEYTLENIFPDWTPAEYTIQKEATSADRNEATLSWSAIDGALAYAIFRNGVYVDMVSGDVLSYELPSSDDAIWTIRAANNHGGFGEESESATGISQIEGMEERVIRTQYFSTDGTQLSKPCPGVNIVVKTMGNGQKVTEKVINK